MLVTGNSVFTGMVICTFFFSPGIISGQYCQLWHFSLNQVSTVDIHILSGDMPAPFGFTPSYAGLPADNFIQSRAFDIENANTFHAAMEQSFQGYGFHKLNIKIIREDFMFSLYICTCILRKLMVAPIFLLWEMLPIGMPMKRYRLRRYSDAQS